MKVSLYLPDKEKNRLIEYMVDEIYKQIKKRLENGESKLNGLIKSYVRNQFFSSPAYKSLTNGQLKEDLGLDSGAVSYLTDIIDKILENCQTGKIEVKTYAKRFQIFYNWGFLQAGYVDLTSLKGSSYISDQMKHWSHKKVPWLEWLLLGCPGVQGYFVARVSAETAEKYHSRSGRALMFRAVGHTWNLNLENDSSVVGGLNERDNFLIKIFENIGQVIYDYVRLELE